MKTLSLVLQYESLNRFLRYIFYFFILTVALTTVISSLNAYFELNTWKMGDWLINYNGGFIRRGLPGQLALMLAGLTYINPGIWVLLFQVLFYAVFLFFSFLLVKSEKNIIVYAPLIFSPFLFTFHIYDLQAGGRKEIIFFALLSFTVYAARNYNINRFNKNYNLILLCYPFVILTHEMLAVFLPYLLIVNFIKNRNNKYSFKSNLFLLLPSIVTFLISITGKVSSTKVNLISEAVVESGYPLPFGGALVHLNKNISDGFIWVRELVFEQNYLFYSIFLLYVVWPYILIKEKFKKIFKNRINLLLAMTSIVGTTVLFLIAADWGRFIYIHLVSLFLISLAVTVPVTRLNSEDRKGFTYILYSALYTFFILVYSMSWYLPHFGDPTQGFYRSKFTKINAVNILLPYKKLISNYNEYRNE